MTKVSYAAFSDRGRVRQQNEDAWFARVDLGLYGVTDGMGGQAAGELAAQVVAETLPSTLRKHLSGIDQLDDPRARAAISTALISLSEALVQESSGHVELRGLGATVVFLLVRNSQAVVAHMGDSRAYIFRGHRLSQLTEDHTLAELLVKAGELDGQGVATHPGRSQLTRFVGMPGEQLPDIGECFDLYPGDQLLLCSDGLTNMLSDDAVAEALTAGPNCDTACRRLVDAANSAGGRDNITALVLEIE